MQISPSIDQYNLQLYESVFIFLITFRRNFLLSLVLSDLEKRSKKAYVSYFEDLLINIIPQTGFFKSFFFNENCNHQNHAVKNNLEIRPNCFYDHSILYISV